MVGQAPADSGQSVAAVPTYAHQWLPATLPLPNSGCQLPYLCPTVAASYPTSGLVGCQLLSVQVWLARLRLILGNLQPQYLPQPQQWLPAPECPGLVGQAPADSGQSAAAVSGLVQLHKYDFFTELNEVRTIHKCLHPEQQQRWML